MFGIIIFLIIILIILILLMYGTNYCGGPTAFVVKIVFLIIIVLVVLYVFIMSCFLVWASPCGENIIGSIFVILIAFIFLCVAVGVISSDPIINPCWHHFNNCC
jgi:hypothetical protein